MIKKEKFTINTECQLMNKKTMKTWDLMGIKEDLIIFLGLKISQISGEQINKEKDLKIFLVTSKIFSDSKDKKIVIDLLEVKILLCI